MKTTLSNSFHGTTAVVSPVLIKAGRYAGYHLISRQTVLRLRRELCGVATCVCGGQFGQRGGYQFDVVDEVGNGDIVVRL